MKRVLVVLILVSTPFSAQNLIDQKITLNVKNISLKDLLKVLEQRSEFVFSYNNFELPLERKVTLSSDDESLYEILKRLTRRFHLTFYRVNDHIIIKKAKAVDVYNAEPPTGSILGLVSDAFTGEPLTGASVYLEDTGFGAATNQEGRFVVIKIQPDKYKLKVSYIGYLTREFELNFSKERIKELFIELTPTTIQGETIVVSEQAFGQTAAINQQLSANTIKNVVSSEKILELPDANAAESVGRLPGISLIRNDGEGERVVIRGLSPTYNSVAVGGIRVPATDDSDRSVDLSIISSEILAGIEVIKALTPDRDADSFGGMINFKLKKALQSGFKSSLRLQFGANELRNDYGNYKGTWIFSDRFFNNKLGIVVAGHIERNQRGSDSYEVEWEITREKRTGEEYAPMSATQVDIGYNLDERKKYGFNALFDYIVPNGSLFFRAFLSSRSDKVSSQTIDYYYSDALMSRYLLNSETRTAMNSVALGGEHEYNWVNIDWAASISQSSTITPYSNSFGFNHADAYSIDDLPTYPTADDIINASTKDLSDFYANAFERGSSEAEEKENSYQLNIEFPYAITQKLAGKLKLGGKFRDNRKVRDDTELIRTLYSWSNSSEIAMYHSQYGNPGFEFQYVSSNGAPSILNYIDYSSNFGKILNGKYDFSVVLSQSELNHLVDAYLLDSAMVVQRAADLSDYETEEQIGAGYLMTELNYGQEFMLLAGIRYEHTYTYLLGKQGTVPNEVVEYDYSQNPVEDADAEVQYSNWFPMFHFRFRPAEWCNLRLAYSKTISRPRREWMLPSIAINSGTSSVDIGRPELKPQISRNLDAHLSFHSNRLGLLTIGSFYKSISNLIYYRTGHKILNASEEGFPSNWKGLTLNSPENNSYKTKVYGLEFEWQSNLWWLPKPLNGLVISLNYSHIWSKTDYPKSFVKNTILEGYPYLSSTVIDTTRSGKMPDQADDVFNLSFGYDNGDFSGRFSVLYQGKSLYEVGSREELDSYTSPITRLDLSLKYRFSKSIGIFLNINNILNTVEQSYQQRETCVSSIQYFGTTSDLGVVLEF
ncbi:MAG: TonB-dependent receptor [Ignavibacteria bacterium]|jgi:TonB-dependent receptor